MGDNKDMDKRRKSTVGYCNSLRIIVVLLGCACLVLEYVPLTTALSHDATPTSSTSTSSSSSSSTISSLSSSFIPSLAELETRTSSPINSVLSSSSYLSTSPSKSNLSNQTTINDFSLRHSLESVTDFTSTLPKSQLTDDATSDQNSIENLGETTKAHRSTKLDQQIGSNESLVVRESPQHSVESLVINPSNESRIDHSEVRQEINDKETQPVKLQQQSEQQLQQQQLQAQHTQEEELYEANTTEPHDYSAEQSDSSLTLNTTRKLITDSNLESIQSKNSSELDNLINQNINISESLEDIERTNASISGVFSADYKEQHYDSGYATEQSHEFHVQPSEHQSAEQYNQSHSEQDILDNQHFQDQQNHSAGWRGEGEAGGGVGCGGGCGKSRDGIDESYLIKLHTEKIKKQLLKKLGFTSPPQVSENRWVSQSLPYPLYQPEAEQPQLLEEWYLGTDYHTEDMLLDYSNDSPHLIMSDPPLVVTHASTDHLRQVIILATPASLCRERCYLFNVEEKFGLSDMRTALLRFYIDDELRYRCKTRSLTLFVLHADDVSTNITSGIHFTDSTPWVTIDLFKINLVAWWVSYPSHNMGVQITCSDPSQVPTGQGRRRRFEAPVARQPYLEVGVVRRANGRAKRSTGCADGACCRMKPLYINFSSIGWSFIVHPIGYWANYCHGPCSDNPMERTGHSAVTGYARMNNSPGTEELTSCCAPAATSPLTLLYTDEQGALIKEDVANMIVESCGCL